MLGQSLYHQIKQFFEPYPAVGSWAYNWQMRQYDRMVGKPAVTDVVDLESPGEANNNGTDQSSINSNPDGDCSSDNARADSANDESTLDSPDRPDIGSE